MNKKKASVALIAIVILGGLAWAFLAVGPDPQVAKVVELQGKLFSENSAVPPDQRREAFEELRKEAEKLTPEQREQMMRDNPPPFVRQMQQNVVAYFDLPQDQRKGHLDKQIDEMEKRRKEWEKIRVERSKQQGDGVASGPGGPGSGGPGPGGPGFGGPGGPPGGFGRSTDPTKQTEMRTKMLDNTSPQQRAMFSEYMEQLQQRRRERGLPAMGGPRF